jgi:hypothetical protein
MAKKTKKTKSTSQQTKLPIPHYVCMGCRFTANEPGKCPTGGCPRHRNPLSQCQCKDGKHASIPELDAAGFSKKTGKSLL